MSKSWLSWKIWIKIGIKIDSQLSKDWFKADKKLTRNYFQIKIDSKLNWVNKTENSSVQHSRNWLKFDWILTKLWLNFDCILTEFWLLLTEFWFLTEFWLFGIYSILVQYSYLCSISVIEIPKLGNPNFFVSFLELRAFWSADIGFKTKPAGAAHFNDRALSFLWKVHELTTKWNPKILSCEKVREFQNST